MLSWNEVTYSPPAGYLYIEVFSSRWESRHLCALDLGNGLKLLFTLMKLMAVQNTWASGCCSGPPCSIALTFAVLVYWQTGLVVLVFRKEDQRACSSCRGNTPQSPW